MILNILNSIFNQENIIILIKLALSVVLAGFIGLERQKAQKSAGFRTYALVSLGACMISLVSLDAFDRFIGITNFDPSRVISNVIVSIGFLGAGIIFHQGLKVEGITTAAGIWVSAIIGITVAVEFYFLAIAGTVTALILMSIFRRFNLD